MVLTNKNEKEVTRVNKAKNWIRAKKMIVAAYVTAVICKLSTVTAFASGQAVDTSTADAKWKTFVDFITPWIERIGGGTFLVGAIMFGLAWRSNDAEGKGNAINTMIGGGIVLAVGVSADIFLL